MTTILLGFAALYLTLDRLALALGSFRGEWGVLVCLVVVGLAILVEMATSWCWPKRAGLLLGLGRSRVPALVVSVVVSVVLVSFFPVYSAVTGTPLTVDPGWWMLLPGLLAQGGIAGEVVFRGYLFRHFREGRTFWRAAVLSAIPFVLAHFAMFMTVDLAIATISVTVALALTFPLAWLYERAGNSIWPGAILHFIVQGAITLVVAPEGQADMLALWWMGLSIVAAWAVFALRPRPVPVLTPSVIQT